MPSVIAHVDGLFFQFSSISDMPVTEAMPRAQFEACCLHFTN